jgi:hypothetical protein
MCNFRKSAVQGFSKQLVANTAGEKVGKIKDFSNQVSHHLDFSSNRY